MQYKAKVFNRKQQIHKQKEKLKTKYEKYKLE